MRKILTLLFFVAALVFIYAVYADIDWLRTISKPLPLVMLLLLVKPNYPYSKLIFTGFLFSLAGDILLMKTLDLFLYGLVAFLVAHVFYIWAFAKRYKHFKPLSSLPFYAIAILLGYYFYPHLGELMLPVFAYIFVIITMLWRSFLQRNAAKYAAFAFLGAFLFVLSDTNIAYTRFVSDYQYSKIATIATYWAAQYLIYLSTTQTHRKRRR